MRKASLRSISAKLILAWWAASANICICIFLMQMRQETSARPLNCNAKHVHKKECMHTQTHMHAHTFLTREPTHNVCVCATPLKTRRTSWQKKADAVAFQRCCESTYCIMEWCRSRPVEMHLTPAFLVGPTRPPIGRRKDVSAACDI